MKSNADQIKKDLKKTYEQIAEDFSASRSQAWPEFELFSKSIPSGSSVLDLGCGNGRFLAYLLQQKKNIDYTGVDFSPALLKLARLSYPKQEFLEQDMTELHLDRLFDRIVCCAAFHHIPTRKLRLKTLKKISAHLKDDGLLLLSVWNLWKLRYLSAHIKAWFTRDLFIPFGKEKVLRYYHAFFPWELKRLLRQAGFQMETFQSSRFNFVVICRKSLLSPVTEPLFVNPKKWAEGLRESTASTCNALGKPNGFPPTEPPFSIH